MAITQFIDLLFRKTLVPLNSIQLKRNPNENFFVAELKKKANKIIIGKNTQLAHDQWLENIINFKNHILTQDPKNFLQWNIIRKTMFIGNALFTIPEFFYIRLHNWNKWKKAIIEKNYVHTEPYLLYPKSSGNLIHQAYHVAKFEKISGREILDFDFIFEYGGGYGSMCQLVQNLGFKGKYIIFDLPILSALQNFFLKINRLKTSLYSFDKRAEIFCLDNINEVEKTIPKKGKKLFIATWSLSESPLEIRKKIYPIIQQMNAHLIGYQDYFGDVDNHQYFKDYRKRLSKLQWWNQAIIQLKGNFYLFGFE